MFSGAADGNRTRLNLIDSEVPSQSATTANLELHGGFEPQPKRHLERVMTVTLSHRATKILVPPTGIKPVSPGFQAGALIRLAKAAIVLVGPTGLEPVTPCSSGKRSTN